MPGSVRKAPRKVSEFYRPSGAPSVTGPILTLIDSYPSVNQDTVHAIYSTGDVAGGQSFIPVSDTTLDSVVFFCDQSGLPTGNAVAKLYSHSGTFGVDGVPDVLLATSDNLDVSTIRPVMSSTSLQFSGSNRYSLLAGTPYFITFEFSGGDDTHYVELGTDDTNLTSSGNTAFNFGGWYSTTFEDVIFYLYGVSTGAISVNLVGVPATPAIGTGRIDATFAVSGVAATPAIGTGAFTATFTASGVAASPAIGVGVFSVNFAVSGVVANAAIGATRIDVTAVLGSVAATPAIGIGTVTTDSGAIDVAVNLIGVGANPQIGTGTVLIGAVVTPPVQLVAGGRLPWSEDVEVYLTGVAANPQVGKITAYDTSQLSKIFPFPRQQTAPQPIPHITARRKAKVEEKLVPQIMIVRLCGAQSMPVVGAGTVNIVADLLDDEVMGLIELLELEEAA